MKKSLLLVISVFTFATSIFAQSDKTLLFYCGITMVKPMVEISQIIEKKHNCTIQIIQGGSKDLYDSLSLAKKGDFYLPGSISYRNQYLKDGFLLDFKEVGYNQAAIFVQKGNPKNIASIDDALKENIAVTICDPNTGSIGKMTKKVLTSYKDEDFFYEVFDKSIEIGTDSRNLNKSIIDKKSDMSINWRATAFWPENIKYIDIVEIDEKYAPKKKLAINLLKFSSHPKIALDLMNYAASQEGQDIMKKYGFK